MRGSQAPCRIGGKRKSLICKGPDSMRMWRARTVLSWLARLRTRWSEPHRGGARRWMKKSRTAAGLPLSGTPAAAHLGACSYGAARQQWWRARPMAAQRLGTVAAKRRRLNIVFAHQLEEGTPVLLGGQRCMRHIAAAGHQHLLDISALKIVDHAGFGRLE